MKPERESAGRMADQREDEPKNEKRSARSNRGNPWGMIPKSASLLRESHRADLAPQLVKKREELRAALQGRVRDHHRSRSPNAFLSTVP